MTQKSQGHTKKETNGLEVPIYDAVPVAVAGATRDLGDGVFWIGLETDDVFRCNPYVIVDGEEAVVIDPGGLLYAEAIIAKIREVVAPEKIRYIVCHHQDPDVCSMVNALRPIVAPSCQLVCHSRMSVLIKHFGAGFEFYDVDKRGMRLTFGNGRELQFGHTPYLHSPGAIVSYDTRSRTIFTSDMFGAVSKEWQLFADERLLAAVDAFHVGYMPSPAILQNGVDVLRSFEGARRLAPQHGSIIDGPLVETALSRLESLQVGTYADTAFEKQIKEQEESLRMRRLVENASVRLMVCDEDGVIRYLNPSAVELFKTLEDLLPVTAEEIVGQKFDIFHSRPAYQRELLREHVKSFPRATTVQLGAHELSIDAFAIYDDDGGFKGLGVSWEDITEKRRVEREIRSKVDHLNSMPIPVMALDRDFNITYLNPAGAKVGGVASAEEAVGRKCYDLFCTTHCRTGECRSGQAMQFGDTREGETVAKPGGGNEVPIRYVAKPALDPDGNIVGALEYIIDQTAEKAIQAQLKGSVTMLETVVAGVDGVSSELSDRSGEISEQASNVAAAAEELSTTMSVVAQSAQESQDNVNSIAQATNEMSSTVGEIAENAEKARGVAENAVKSVAVASDRVDELGRAANEISQVTETIVEIAEQTKLLALNATIEAARAGEAGKGFAVVASEVKELAKQTNGATADIREKIKAIQKSTESTIAEISSISGVIHEVNDFVGVIAAATEEQSATTKEISENLDHVKDGIRDMAANVTQSAEVTQELTGNITTVSNSLAEVDATTAQLTGEVKKLEQTGQELLGVVARYENSN
jgi:PAS domain S-box-containing protein